jgi:type VI secretion system protein ImpK
MSDNPFSEPEDNERTILRGPGAGRPGIGPGPGPQQARAPVSPMPGATPVQPLAPAARLAGEAESLPKVGKSPLTAAAAPLLDLLSRIGGGAQAAHVANPDELRDRAVRALQAFEAECRVAQVPDEQLRAAHYALCAALDDSALATPWGQSSSWSTRSLSSAFHQDVRSGERFFDLLAGLQREPGRYLPALEVCYLCLSLGMRGRYRLDPRGSAEIERIREGLYQILSQLNGPFERDLSAHWQGVDAPHKGPGRAIPAWVALAVVVALLAFAWIWASSSVNARSDALQQHLVQLPPGKLPGIERKAPSVAPAAAPPAAPDAVDRLRKFLASEIAEGLVTVEGDPQRLLIRVTARGMFDSGSATVQPKFTNVLGRIGEALGSEPGRITVLGHSDNQPIRTVQFPSNFQLSAARAQSAMAVLAGNTGQPERFSSAGRADTEPLAANDTPEGREKNRRIDIVLSRGGAS